jgi:hypothetical protein
MIALSLWTHQFGLLGVISLVVAAGVLERALAAIHFGRLLGVTRRDVFLLRDLGKLGLASLFAALVAAASRPRLGSATPLPVLVISGALFAGVYLAVVHIQRVLSPDERDRVRIAVARYLPRPLRYELE